MLTPVRRRNALVSIPFSITGNVSCSISRSTSSRDWGNRVAGVGTEYCWQIEYRVCLLDTARARPTGCSGRQNALLRGAARSATSMQLSSSVGIRIGREPMLRASPTSRSRDSAGGEVRISQKKFCRQYRDRAAGERVSE